MTEFKPCASPSCTACQEVRKLTPLARTAVELWNEYGDPNDVLSVVQVAAVSDYINTGGTE